MSVPHRMMETLGNEWGGNANPPRAHRTLYVHDDGLYRVFATENDGYEVGIGYPDKWQVFMSWKAARMFAWWVLKIWVVDWFGFRTYLWYRALFRSVHGRWEKPRKHPKSVWKSSYDDWWQTDGKSLHND